MNQYEVTFIVDPVLSGDEIKSTAQTYVDLISKEGTIVHTDEMGLRQLAYPIRKRTTGVYYCIEFQVPNGEMISKMELAFRRDERIMRFLTVRLDKFGIKFNDDRRNGLIGKKKSDKKEKDAPKETAKKAAPAKKAAHKPLPKSAPKAVQEVAAAAVSAAPVVPVTASKSEEE